MQALEAEKAPELLHYILSAGLNSATESEARRRLVEALEATVPRDKVSAPLRSANY